jgi:hypothetical protein
MLLSVQALLRYTWSWQHAAVKYAGKVDSVERMAPIFTLAAT